MFQPNVAQWQQQQQPQRNDDGKWAQQQNPTALNNVPATTTTNNNQDYFNNFGNYQQQPQQQPHQLQSQINNAYFQEIHNQQPIGMQQQQIQQQEQQTLSQNFFDNTQNSNNNSNNNVNRTDGWGDWGEWNDNTENNNNNQQPIQQPQNTVNIINDSFIASDNNWNWNMNLNTEQQQQKQQQSENNMLSISNTATTSAILPPPPAMQAQQQSVPHNASNVQQPPAQLLERQNDNTLQQQQHPQIAVATTNIPNSVYVTQAKPVTMPPRQFASPPNDMLTPSTPITEPVFAPPPEGFQNEIVPTITATPVAMPTMNLLPPSQQQLPTTIVGSMPPISLAISGNTTKRAGPLKHHVSNFISTLPITNNKSVPNVPAPSIVAASYENNLIYEPPPPQFNYEQPDNSEVLHENQEVVIQTQPIISLPSHQPPPPPASQPQPQQQQHLNDERNKYLQTSHLSEIAFEDSNIEADSTLPPPGLSRLVLGQPELDANQRLVTGTEEPQPQHLVGNMSLDERQADGEDNANDAPTTRGVVTGGPVAGSTASSVSSMQITADRNLYLVPGQSNGNNDQLPRVLTGFDNVLQIDTPTPTHQNQTQTQQPHINIAEQREIELDGENIEDQHQQQQQLHQMVTVAPPPQQHRNEPPVEGAAAPVEQSNTNLIIDSKESTQTICTKEDNELEHHRKYLSNSRKQLDKEQQHQHERKQSSVDHYNSDDESEEAEYSSDRERERERNRQLRNYREGSVRSEHGRDRDRERDRNWEREREEDYLYQKQQIRRRDHRERENGEKDKLPRDKYYRDADNGLERHSKRYTRYELDSSLDESSRIDKSHHRRSTRGNRERGERERERDNRSDREYYELNKRNRNSKRVNERDGDTRGRREREVERDYEETPGVTDRRRNRPRIKNATSRTAKMERAEYDEHRKPSSRNARESDNEKGHGSRAYDPRYAAAYGYSHGGQTAGGAYDAYDHYAYYYHQMAMYKQYYGAHNAVNAGDISAIGGGANSSAPTGASSDHLTGDGRESVHSGRSSLQQEHNRPGNVSLRDGDILTDPQRLTPSKFVNEHTVASLSTGLLVTVKPKYTAHGQICNVVKVHRIGVNDATRQIMQTFPGPLIRGQTHKKTIIEFCEEKIRQGPNHTTIYAKQLVNNDIEIYRPSHSLMWNLLILLLRQNGMVVGTDIAELLLKNQREFPYQIVQNSLRTLSENEESPTEANTIDKAEENEVEVENVAVENKENLATQVLTLSEEEITDKFRQYLLYGNVNEALDWAADNNLWGHALFLASKMDRRTHANVMMKFANKLSLNDPLQTLYQLMSGRTPSSVTSVQDEKWGDWRPHLSMILSNTSQKPELDRKAITTLGDSLFNRGDLYAAHFCYLMAQVGFGRYQDSATQETSLQQHLPKLVLLGSSSYKSFRDFATNEAVIMTEIYEYACSLNDDKFSIVEFQPYKYLYATRLLDYGYHLKCLMYMEQIAIHIERHPTKFDTSFINKIFELADRLKYYDPVLEKTVGDQQTEGNDDSLNDASQGFEEQKWLQNLRLLTLRQHENTSNLSAAESIVNQPYASNNIDQQFMELNKQFNELNLQYAYAEPMQQQPQQQPVADLPPQPQLQQYSQEAYGGVSGQTYPTTNFQSTLQPEEPQHNQPPLQQHQYGFYGVNNQEHQQQPIASAYDGAVPNHYSWSEQQPQYPTEENVQPTISLPKSKTYDTDDETQQRQPQQRLTENQQPRGSEAEKLKSKQDKNKENKRSQPSQNSGWFGGIWNKWSLKPKNQMILPDDTNPAIVWDDKKKRWVNTDGEEKEEENFKPPPKMGDLILPPQQQPQQEQPMQQHTPLMQQQLPQQAPLLAQPPIIQAVNNDVPLAVTPNLLQSAAHLNQPAATKTPSLQSNMFKMQRNRTLKNSYVDVFNPSGAPISNAAENIMAPVLPPATVPVAGFFNPGETPMPSAGEATAYQQQNQQQNVPQFYNPNQFGSNVGGGY